jgi:asparagine synthase (glutamine-hydrolysing)
MCGIAGILSLNPSEIHTDRLRKMTDAIVHRGPDGSGHWISEDGQVAFGHRRLSILDLSESGAQPMHYLDRYTITFNGEIYNYIEIREKLLAKGYQFMSHSDTEVLLALYDHKKETCLDELDGMFAFAIHDRVSKKVFCARDRFGEKPFFYHHTPTSFFFGSEMKSLWTAGVPKNPDPGMIFNYLQFDLVDNPADPSQTFFQGIKRLGPGHFLVWEENKIQIQAYWKIDPKKRNPDISLESAADRFRELFNESVSRRLRSDVMVGSSLSGGIDSSLVVCVIDQLLKDHPESIQNTFSARFANYHKDEGYFIQKVKEVARITSHEVYSDIDQLESLLDKISYHQEEPFGSASILVQYQVYELAKKMGVTVLLDGQGADEILAGYHFYFPTFFNELRKSSKSKMTVEFQAYEQRHRENLINAKIPKPGVKEALKSYFPVLFNNLSRKIINSRLQNSAMMNAEFFGEFRGKTHNEFNYSPADLNQHLYFSTFELGLPTLLRYADRNSMDHSREVRLPFLSHELVDFVYSLPSEYKIQKGWTKFLMRKSFDELLPKEIAWRKDKIGFEPPQKKWMENPRTEEKVRESRRKLVSLGILEKGAESRAVGSAHAHSMGDGSWNHLMIGKLFE